jgi:hypothetical protein
MRITALIFPLIASLRVALYELPQKGAVWMRDFNTRAEMIAALHDIGIIGGEEAVELVEHDFAAAFATTQAKIDIQDAPSFWIRPLGEGIRSVVVRFRDGRHH